MTTPSPMSAVLSASAGSSAGRHRPRRCDSIGSSQRQRVGQRAHRQPGFETGKIGQLGHESAVDKDQPPKAAAGEHAAGVVRARLRRGVGRRRPAAWPRASAAAGRCISRLRRDGAADPPSANDSNAAARPAAMAPPPGSACRDGRVEHRPGRAQLCVLIGRTSAFMPSAASF